VKAREYAGPLGVLAAGAIGISLLCSVSAMAMGDLNNRISITIEPLNIVDLAYSNIETAAALTEQVVTAFVPTQTLLPTDTLSPIPLASDTSTPRRFVTVTPTGTRRPRSTLTSTLIPTKPPTSLPTRTNTPIPPTITFTPIPTATQIPTNTLMPTSTTVPTSTQAPTDTPQPTDTSSPPTEPPTPVDVTVPPETPVAPGPLFEATGTSP
jgi:hypothetical protein